MKSIQRENIKSENSNHSFFFQKGGSNFLHGEKNKPFFNTFPIQPKLTVNQLGDQYEKEADAMADQLVHRLSEPDSIQTKYLSSITSITPSLLQPKCAECEQEEMAQKKGGSISESESMSSLENRLASSRGSGSPMPNSIRKKMESTFVSDFGDVRLHTNADAVQLSRNLNAQAFTKGQDIYFNQGKYNPGNREGQHLLAHELTHVVQQKGATGYIQKADSLESGVKEHGDLSQIPPDMVDCPHATTSPANEGTVNYPISSHELSPSIRTSLIVFVDSWRSSGANAHIRIDGYASVDGTEAYNWRLSCNRAKALKEELVFQAISSSYIDIYAHGETNRFSAGSYEPNRVATLTSTLPPPIPPTPDPVPVPEPKPEEKNVCGPDITSSLGGVLSKVDRHFHGLSWWKKRRSCGALDVDAPFVFVNPIMAWDVRHLFLPSTWWLDAYYTSSGCGSPRNAGCDTDPQRHLCEEGGTCGNTVLVGGKCMLAGTANYAIYGRMFKLCNDEFSPDFPRWDMRAMINMYKALSVFFGYDDPEPPREMATAVFDGTFPAIPSAAENRAHCKGRCSKTHSGSFSFVWEPYKPR